jgi:hypothetical protein
MPARRDTKAKAETKLTRVRMSRGVTQEELADATGVSIATYSASSEDLTANRGGAGARPYCRPRPRRVCHHRDRVAATGSAWPVGACGP